MKKALFLCLVATTLLHAQTSKTVDLGAAGNLYTAFTSIKISSIII